MRRKMFAEPTIVPPPPLLVPKPSEWALVWNVGSWHLWDRTDHHRVFNTRGEIAGWIHAHKREFTDTGWQAFTLDICIRRDLLRVIVFPGVPAREITTEQLDTVEAMDTDF